MKDINQDLSEEEENKKDNIVAGNTKICLKIKKISQLVNIEKIIINKGN